MNDELRRLIEHTDALSYIQEEFSKLQSPSPYLKHPYFSSNKHPRSIQEHFLSDLSIWLENEYGSIKRAVEKLKEQFPEHNLSERTLYNWRKENMDLLKD